MVFSVFTHTFTFEEDVFQYLIIYSQGQPALSGTVRLTCFGPLQTLIICDSEAMSFSRVAVQSQTAEAGRRCCSAARGDCSKPSSVLRMTSVACP